MRKSDWLLILLWMPTFILAVGWFAKPDMVQASYVSVVAIGTFAVFILGAALKEIVSRREK